MNCLQQSCLRQLFNAAVSHTQMWTEALHQNNNKKKKVYSITIQLIQVGFTWFSFRSKHHEKDIFVLSH